MQTHQQPGARIIACLLVAALLLSGCGHGGHKGGESVEAQAAYYDADGFVWDGGRCRYVSGGVTYGRTGVDVSSYQDYVDWDAVAADGIDFAFLRVGYRGTTEGGLFRDERFDDNLWAAQAAGIGCGAYFYSQATSVEEAREEAEFVLDVLDGRYLEYPVAFDHEAEPDTRLADIGDEVSVEIAAAFCETIRAGGYEPMVYGNTYDLVRMGAPTMDGCAVWCAEYDHDPSYAGAIRVWQYTGEGIVAGFSTHVDLNLYLGDVPVA